MTSLEQTKIQKADPLVGSDSGTEASVAPTEISATPVDLGPSQPSGSDVVSNGDSGEDESVRQESDARPTEIAEAALVTDSDKDPASWRQPELDSKLRAYATGRRKRAVARVWVKSSDGRFAVNGRKLEDYFTRPVLQMIVRQPFEVIGQNDTYTVYCTVKGGGLSGQAGALRHGLARALDRYNPILRPLLKQAGLLTRDSRMVERKKYGRPKARRSFQFSKR